MEYFVNCNNSSINEYTGTLDANKAAHLYKRLGFSASIKEINAIVTAGTNATELIDQLINEALALPTTPAPTWADWNWDNYPEGDDGRRPIINQQREEWQIIYGNAILNNNLRDRLSFFWSNHFVAELKVYECSSFLYYYINCLQRNAIGNFKTFVSEIGLTDAMLYYLDGVYNNKNKPNENYARELYELFTLGDGNGYTEEDIIETAKALTGYVERGETGCSPTTFDSDKHNIGNKTIFGQSANFDYDGVIDNLFVQRTDKIAGFICKKLYEFFVHPDSVEGNAPSIINELSATFIANDFEIAPVLSQLFKSEHFFDDEAIGVIIKSPFDVFYNFFKETDFTITDTNISEVVNYTSLLGQKLFDPVDVAGWQRNRSWINTNFFIGRWLTIETIIDDFYTANPEEFRELAMNAVGPANAGTSNPEIVVQAIINKFTPKGLLTLQDFENAMSSFKIGDIPENYYSPDYVAGGQSLWMLNTDLAAPSQVHLLVRHLSRQPEFQLK